MNKFLEIYNMAPPLWIIGAAIGIVSVIMLVAFVCMKDKKEAFGYERNMSDMVILKRLIGYARPYLKDFLLVLLIMGFTIVADLLLPLIIGDVTKVLEQGNPVFARVLRDALLYFAVLLVSLVCTYIQGVYLQKIGQKIISQMREDIYTHATNLSHAQLNAIPVGKLVTRVCYDTNSVSMMFTRILVNLVRNILLIIGYIVVMFVVNVKLATMIMCFVPFILMFTLIFRRFSRRAYRRVKSCTTDINTFLSENLSGIKVTQAFNQEDTVNHRFAVKNDKLKRACLSQISVFSVFRPLIFMLNNLCIVSLFWLAGSNTLSGAGFAGQVIDVAVLTIFYQYIRSFFQPIQDLADNFNMMQNAFASSEKVFTVLDTPPTLKDEEDAIELTEIRGEIEFKDVWFRYVEDEWILKGVSFKVEAGQTVAFVGATGSGKTTILSLMCRNYDIQEGQILLDGIDIRHIKISCLRKFFGQMLQDVFLFSGTVRSNIVLGMECIDDEDIWSACKYVNADGFIKKLENGLDSEVRERGNNFSAGQRQLLSFARTIIHKPAVIILDEATANIDTETELLIQDSLERMMKVGTMLMVAHRLSTIQHADNIIVLDHGEILEQGNHQELLTHHGKYFHLYELQYKKDMLAVKG